MTHSPENVPNSPTEELRRTVLNMALSKTALTGHRGRADTKRNAEIALGEDELPVYRIGTFEEGSQVDGAIVQVSFETQDISEAHLILTEDSMSYDERSVSGECTTCDPVDDVTAAQLLDELSTIITE